MKRMWYWLLSGVSCLAILVSPLLNFSSLYPLKSSRAIAVYPPALETRLETSPLLLAADPDYPEYFGPESRRTMDRIQRVIESTDAARLATIVGTGVTIGTTPTDGSAAGAAIGLCLVTPDNCPVDPSLSAEAAAGLDDIALNRVRTHIELLLLDRDRLSPEEIDFWESMLDALNNPEDIAGAFDGTGVSHGDPHIITFDNFRYSFQTVGEFVLSRSVDDLFEVQVRQARVPGRQVSLNTAVAMNVAGTRLAFYQQNFPDGETQVPLRLDGRPQSVNGQLDLPRGGFVQKVNDNRYEVKWPTGEQAIINLRQGRDFPFIDVVVSAQGSASTRLYEGLLGNFNGDPEDDLRTQAGRVIPSRSTYGDVSNVLSQVLPSAVPLRQAENAYFEQVYRDFGNSWRISQSASLFDYAPNQTTATFTDRAFPSSFLTLRSLTPAQVRQAESICRNEGVEPLFLEGCIFDVGLTDDASFARAAANMVLNQVVDRAVDRAVDEVRDRLPVPVPRPRIRLPF